MRHLLVLSVLLALSVLSAQDLSLAAVYESQNMWPQARDILAEYLRTKPLDAQVYRRYEALEVKLEEFDQLLAFTDSLLAKNPNQANLMLGRADGLIRGGRSGTIRNPQSAITEGIALLNNLVKQNVELAQPVGALFEADSLEPEAIRTYNDYRRRRNNPNIFAPNLLNLYERTKDYAAATREAVTLLNVDPNLAGDYEQKFQSYVVRGNPDPVVAELMKIRDPNVRGWLLAKADVAAGRTSDAVARIEELDSYQKALEFARYCEDAGYLDAALELFIRFTNPPLPYDRARVLRKLGRVQEAAAILQTSSDPVGIYELADLQRIELKDYVSAAANYHKVIAAQPGQLPAWHGLTACLIELGRLSEAGQALAGMPNPDDEVLYDRARIAFYEESFDSSRAQIQDLLKRYPQSPFANDALELLLLATRGGEGLKSFAPALRDYALGQYDSAVAICQNLIRAVELEPGDSASSGPPAGWADRACLLLAECRSAQREFNEAIAAYQEFETRLAASDLRPRARYEAAIVCLDGLKDEIQYRKVMESVYTDFPESPYAALARNRLIPTSKPRQ